ncbi:MAG TPA: hypothetical protein VE842_12425 [Pyrinomonadaceae bacterium]|jgi:hypothetical protein|nr:hypothetical protein [Pyrinomonadaceae bacterium]
MSPCRIIALACVLVALCGGPLAARAQQNSLGVTPASVDARVKRGATHTQTYTIFNRTPVRLRFRCSVSDYWYDEQNRRLTGRPGTLPRSASPWVQLSPSEVVVEPNGAATVKAVITVPQSAAGSYYTMPVFEATPDAPAAQPTPGTETTATAAIGIRFRGLLMLTTDTAAEYNVAVLGGKVTPPTESSTLGFDLDVLNRGTAHARVRGVFAILDSSGRMAGRGKVGEKRFLPGQRDAYKADWAGDLAPGRYTAVVTLTFDRAGAEPATQLYEIPFEVGARRDTRGLADK